MTLPGTVVDPNPPATLDEALQRPEVSPIYLAEVTCGLSLPVWSEQTPGQLYQTYVVDEVVSVAVNGEELATADDSAAVTATPGSWFWDRPAQLLYVHLADDGDPSDPAYSAEALLLYRFSDTATDAGGYAWDPRISDLPSLSMRIPDSFKGVAQIGGGRMELSNLDHFFDSKYSVGPGFAIPGRLRQNWTAGTTVLKMGVVGLPWSEFKILATMNNGGLSIPQSSALLDLREKKSSIDKKYPLNVYTRYEFPAIRQQDEGRAVQVAFGRVRGVNPVCIDVSAREFRVAGHPIRSFDGVKVKNSDTGVWDDVSFLHKDEPNGLFTLAADVWSDGQDVAVDFSGWVRDNGTLADNPAEIAMAVLDDLSQPYNAAAFEEARLWYDAGYFNYDPRQRYTLHPPSLYLDGQNSALETLEEMMRQVRSYLVVNEFGEFIMRPFRCYQASGLAWVHDETDTLGEGITKDPVTSTTPPLSRAVVAYDLRPAQDIKSVEIYEVAGYQHKRRERSPLVDNFETMFVSQKDAQWFAQCLVNESRADAATYKMTLKWRPWLWVVGQHLRVTSDRHGLDVVLEIINLSLNLKDRTASLVLGNLRGFEEASGFWTGSTDTTPLGASLSWPTSGQVPGDESQYKRHQTGIWHNSKEAATETPLTSLDKAVSLWQ